MNRILHGDCQKLLPTAMPLETLIYMPEESTPTIATEGNRKAVAYMECDRHMSKYARLFVSSPHLLKALKAAEAAIEEAADIMHYEDGLPVTALDAREIDLAYTALCSVLVEIHEALERAHPAPKRRKK